MRPQKAIQPDEAAPREHTSSPTEFTAANHTGKALLVKVFITAPKLLFGFAALVLIFLLAGLGIVTSCRTLERYLHANVIRMACRSGIRGKACVILTDEFIEDQTTYLSTGRIHWPEIFAAETIDGLTHRGIALFVEDRDLLYKRLPPVPRWMARRNEEYFGAPVYIPTDCLADSRDLLLEEIRQRITNPPSMRNSRDS